MSEHEVHQPEPVLHIYPLADEHGDARISGNRESLKILKDRLEKALAATRVGGSYMSHGYTDGPDELLFAADGEGYHLAVECRPGGCHAPAWEEHPEPYYVSRKKARKHGMDV